MRKRKIWITAAAALLLTAVPGTYAYFTDEDEKVNDFQIGELEISLEEPEWTPEKGGRLLPGDTWVKNPTVAAAKGNSYIQVKLEILDGNGRAIEEESRLSMIKELIKYDEAESLQEKGVYSKSQTDQYPMLNPDFELCRENGHEMVFRYAKNGGVLREGEKRIVFNRIVVPKEYGNEQMAVLNGDICRKKQDGTVEILKRGNGFQIRVSAEAVQSENLSAAEAEKDWDALWKRNGEGI